MRRFLLLLVVLGLTSAVVFCIWWGYKYYICSGPKYIFDGKDYSEYLLRYANEAKEYAIASDMDEEYCVLVDYGIPSGTPRVFVWSFKEQRVVHSTYTMHGSGRGSTAEKAVYSNEMGSFCSTLGHFAITKKHGKLQKRGFRLKGLDEDNQNAYSRGLMLHRSRWVDNYCWKRYIPLNSKSCLGCVTISSRGFNYIEKLVYKEKKRILLWSFDSSKE